MESARQVCPATWGGVATADVEVVPLTGGITNVLFKLTLRNRPKETPLIVRLFGQGTELFVDRQRENIIFRELSLLGIGSPPFHGLFENGRVEGFLDARSIKPEEMHEALIYPRVATALGRFHAVGPRLSGAVDTQPVLFPKLEAFFDLAQSVSFDKDANKQSLFEALRLPEVRAGLLAHLARQHEERASSALAQFQALPADAPLLSEGEEVVSALSAAVLATQPVLCHNDLLSGNILLSNDSALLQESSKEGVTLIDFEYAGFNPRAYDLANHFNEFAGFDFDIENRFPPQALRFAYLTHYLDAASASSSPHAASEQQQFGDVHRTAAGLILEKWGEHRQRQGAGAGAGAGLEGPCLALVSALDRIVLQYLPASHVFWATWSVVQAANSTIDFDFIAYSKMRLDAVAFHKSLFSI